MIGSYEARPRGRENRPDVKSDQKLSASSESEFDSDSSSCSLLDPSLLSSSSASLPAHLKAKRPDLEEVGEAAGVKCFCKVECRATMAGDSGTSEDKEDVLRRAGDDDEDGVTNVAEA